MAFSKTIDVALTSGKFANKQTLKHNLTLLSGTWTAGGDVTGPIVTGLTGIIAWGTAVDTGTITEEHLRSKSGGTITIGTCAVDNVGSWWALGYI